MKRLLAISPILLGLLLSNLSAVQALDPKDQSIETLPVTKNIYMLKGQGGNIGVSVGPDGVFLIDDQFHPLNPQILAAVKKLSPEAVRFVVNTHWHFDHTGGNEALGKSGAVIVAHENVRKRMSTQQFSAFMKKTFPPSPAAALPLVTFTENIQFHVNGDTARVHHIQPAHTDGDAIIFFESAKAAHLGDLYFAGMYPYIDTGSGGSIGGMIAGVDWVLKHLPADTKIIPGHGPLSDMKELKAYRDLLVQVRDTVAALKKQGKSLAEVQAAKPTAAFDATWGHGFLKADSFVGLVYQSL